MCAPQSLLCCSCRNSLFGGGGSIPSEISRSAKHTAISPYSYTENFQYSRAHREVPASRAQGISLSEHTVKSGQSAHRELPSRNTQERSSSRYTGDFLLPRAQGTSTSEYTGKSKHSVHKELLSFAYTEKILRSAGTQRTSRFRGTQRTSTSEHTVKSGQSAHRKLPVFASTQETSRFRGHR